MSFQPFFSSKSESRENGCPTHLLKSLISWVNSIEYPNCLLATDIKDFCNGVIFCEIVNEIILKNQKPDFLPRIKNANPNYDECIQNLDMALETIRSHKDTIKVPLAVQNLKSEEVINDDSKALMILEFLYNLSKPNVFPEAICLNSDRSQSDKQPNSSRVFHHQRQLTAEFGQISKSEDQGSVQMSCGDKKPPMDPNSAYFKTSRGSNAPSQTIKQVWPQNNLNSVNKVECQSKKNAPMALGEHSHPNNCQSFPFEFEIRQNFEPNLNHHSITPFSSKFGDPSSISGTSSYPELNVSGAVVDFLHQDIQPIPLKNSKQRRNVSSCSGTNRSSKICVKTTVSGKGKENNKIDYSTSNSGYNSRQEEHLNPRNTLKIKEGISNRRINIQSQINPIKPTHKQKTNSLSKVSKINENIEIDQNMPAYASIIMRGYDVSFNSKLRKSNSVSDLKSEDYNLKQAITPLNSSPLRKNKDYTQIVVTPVFEEAKAQILNWLYSINLLNNKIDNLAQKLPKICKNGLIFVDLLNRLESKHEVIKGAMRDSKNPTNIKSNYMKVLNYLKKNEKMNPRYLDAEEYLMKGNEDVFWGLLDDIYCLYHNKMSPFDPRNQKDYTKGRKEEVPSSTKHLEHALKQKLLQSRTEHNVLFIENGIKKAWIPEKNIVSPNFMVPKLKMEDNQNFSSNYSSIPNTGRASPFYSQRKRNLEENDNELLEETAKDISCLSRKESQKESYSVLHSKRTSVCQSGRGTPAYLESPKKSPRHRRNTSKVFTSPETQADTCKTARSRSRSHIEEEENIIPSDIEGQVLEWLEQMGFSSLMINQKASLFEDPLRNGTLLCNLVGKLMNENMTYVYKEPKSIDECRFNIYTAFKILVKKETPIPSFLKGKEEAILKGNRNIIFTLLHSLRKFYLAQSESKSQTIKVEGSCEISSYVPPYSEKQIELLEDSILKWLSSICPLQERRPKVRTFKDLILNLKDGITLCELVGIVLHEKCIPIHSKPNTELQCINNIRKALESLRKTKKMGQKYLWKEKEIYEGNKFIILGLLEDLHRLFNGLEARNSQNYFIDGPYIPNPSTNKNFSARGSSELNQLGTGSNIVNSTHAKALSNMISYCQPKITRSMTCPKTRTEIESRIDMLTLDDKSGSSSKGKEISIKYPVGKAINNSPERKVFLDKGIAEKFLLPENLNVVPELTFSSPFIEEQPELKKIEPFKQPSLLSPENKFEHKNIRNKTGARGHEIQKWLISHSLGDLVKNIDFDQQKIDSFKDGVLLSKIIERLSGEKIVGIIQKPITRKDMIINIQRCLEILSQSRKLRLNWKGWEEKLLEGNGQTLRELLLNIKEAYPVKI